MPPGLTKIRNIHDGNILFSSEQIDTFKLLLYHPYIPIPLNPLSIYHSTNVPTKLNMLSLVNVITVLSGSHENCLITREKGSHLYCNLFRPVMFHCFGASSRLFLSNSIFCSLSQGCCFKVAQKSEPHSTRVHGLLVRFCLICVPVHWEFFVFVDFKEF